MDGYIAAGVTELIPHISYSRCRIGRTRHSYPDDRTLLSTVLIVIFDGVYLLHHTFCPGEESLALRGEYHTIWCTEEYLYIQLFLQLFKSDTDVRLSLIELFSRTGNTALLGNSNNVFKLLKFHNAPLCAGKAASR